MGLFRRKTPPVMVLAAGGKAALAVITATPMSGAGIDRIAATAPMRESEPAVTASADAPARVQQSGNNGGGWDGDQHPGAARHLVVPPSWEGPGPAAEPAGPTVTGSPRHAVPPGVRTLAGAGFVPAGTGRRQRRAANRAAERVRAEAAKAAAAERAAAAAAEKAVRGNAAYLPRSGDPAPDQMHTYRPLRVQQHRATSEVLAGAYPFLAEAGLGEKGVYIGTDSWSGAAFCFDPWQLYTDQVVTNPNVLLAGVIGSGKSTCAKSVAVRSIAFGRKVYVPGDPKGEWTVVAEAVGGQAITLGGGLPTRLNPLDEGVRPASVDPAEWRSTVTARRRDLLRAMVEMSLSRPVTPVEATAVFAALDTAVRGNTVPILPHVVAAMWEPAGDAAGSTVAQLVQDGRDAAHALNRLVGGDLAGLFDGPSTTRFDPALPMVSMDLSRIQGSDRLIALVMTCASTWMEAAIIDPDGGRRWIIYDEAWKLLGSPALLARMQAQWKLSRAWGIANMMVIHRLSDLAAVGDANSQARNLALGLLADCSTKIIYNQEAGEDAKTGAAIGLSAAEIAQLPDLRRGEGLWKIKDRAFMAQNIVTPDELALFDTNTRMVTG